MKTSFANYAIHSLRFLTGASLLVCAFALGGLVSRAAAEPVSISINFGADRNSGTATPNGGDLGAVPVNYQYWNNASGKTGSMSLISNTGAATGVSGAWESSTTYNGKTFPSRDNNAILFYGYLDDGAVNSHNAYFSMTAPYFSYDIYYYAATDVTSGSPHRYATINSVNYCGASTGTIVGTSSWGTPVTGNINASDLKEGVNYLKVSSSDPEISIYGAPKSGNYRGSFGAVQIVNTADSQSRIVSGDFTWNDSAWTNDLTGETEQAYNPSAVGYRLINATDETVNPTIDLGGSTAVFENLKTFGIGKISFTNGVTTIGKTNIVSNFADDYSDSVGLSNKVAVVPQGVVKFATGVSVSDATANQDAISGAYVVDGSTVSFARITNGQIVAITPEYAASPTDGMDLNVTAKITDNATRTLNSLTSSFDYVNNSALTITSGMMALQTKTNGNSHWVQGGGTITSGYQNADGEYDLYVCGVGAGEDLRIDSSTVIDNPAGKLNLIKTGSGKVGLTDYKKTYDFSKAYTGKTSVLEGCLFFGVKNSSTQFYVADGATLDFSCRNKNNDHGDIDFTATELTGSGTVIVGNSKTVGSLTLNNVVNDGSAFTAVNVEGKYLTLNNSELHAATLNNKSRITLNNSTIVAGTMANTGAVTISFKGESVLDAAISTANALTIDVESGKETTFGKVVSGAGSLVKDGAGTLELSANNTYGETVVNEGTLKLSKAGETGTLKPGSKVTVTGSTSVLSGNGNDVLGYKYKSSKNTGAIGSLYLLEGGTLHNESGTNHITVNNAVYMNHGFITAAEGDGNETAGNFTFDNTIHVTGGEDNLISATRIQLRTIADTYFTTGEFAGQFDVAQGAKLTISSIINDTSNVAITNAGAGELVLTGKSPFKKNVTINGGVLDLTSGALYTGDYITDANVNVNTGGTLKVNNFGYNEAGNSSLGGLTYSSNGSTNIHFNGGTIQIAESFGETINRKIELQENGGTLDLAEGVELVLGANIHGAGGLTKAGAGTMELTYANEYTGGTTVSGGYLKLTDDAVRDNGSMTVAEGATLEYALAGDQPTPTLAFDADKKFASEGTVLKTGAGALKIDAAEGSFDASTLTVVEGRLDMKSYLTGRLEINNGAMFSPGNSVGKLNVTGSVALGQAGVDGDAAQVIIELGGSSRDQNDELVVTGDLELNNARIVLEMAEGSGLYPGESFTAVFSSGNSDSYKSNFINTYVQAPYYLIDLSYTEISPGLYAITGTLDGNALPEPATWALLLLGAFGLLYWRKRK